MCNQINIKIKKSRKFLELLLKGVDRRRKHDLYLASCYFSPDSAIKLISEILNNNIKLESVFLYIDRRTALAVGKIKLQDVCNRFTDLNVQLFAVDSIGLFHTKAYAIISNDNDGIYRGSLIVGSSNLTGAGLTDDKYGNIESLLDTQDVDLVSEFIKGINKLKLLSIDEIDDFKNKSSSFVFKYALLLEGSFVHKWSDSLGQYLAVKYQLSDYGRDRIDGDDIFKKAGFNVDSATISKRYFKFNFESPHLEKNENLIRNFGIETYLGHWVANSALEEIFESDMFDEFCNYLKEEIYLQLDGMEKEIEKDTNYLKLEKMIDESDSNFFQSLKSKTDTLLKNKEKLKRIFSKYEIFSLPYDISQKDKIIELFDQMISLIHSRTNKNISQKAFLKAVDSASVEEFKIAIKGN